MASWARRAADPRPPLTIITATRQVPRTLAKPPLDLRHLVDPAHRRQDGGEGTPMAAKRGPGRPRKESGETVVPQHGGDGIMSRSSQGLRAYVHAHNVIEYDLVELGAMLQGFLQEGVRPITPDVESMFPPNHSDGCGCNSCGDNKAWKALAQERELGREMLRNLPLALVKFQITPQAWACIYQRAMAQLQSAQVCSPQGLQQGTAGFISPLGQPSEVTSQFGMRNGQPHTGLDLRAAVGTPVVAPIDLRIFDVGQDDESGLYVQGIGRRPDGRFPEIPGPLASAVGESFGTGGEDDSAWIVSVSHLSGQSVRVGQDVSQGQQIGVSGATGDVTGPHLHLKTEWYSDGIFNQKTYVDPLALIPTNALSSPGSTVGPVQGTASAFGALFSNGRSDPFARLQSEAAVIVNNSVIAIANAAPATVVGSPGGGNQVAADVDLGLFP